jgi:hypothetical protein
MARLVQGIEEESDDETSMAPVVKGIEEETSMAPIVQASDPMHIFVKTSTGKTLYLHVDAMETVGSVRAKIQATEGPTSLRCLMTFTGKLLKDPFTLAHYQVKNLDTINMFAPLAGGAKTIKRSLKKDQLVVNVQKRFKDKLKETFLKDVVPPQTVPHVLTDIVRAIENDADKIRRRFNNGEAVIHDCIEKMSDAKLKSMMSDFVENAKKSGIQQDDRLLDIALFLFPEIDDLDAMTSYLNKVKCDCLALFADIMMHEYGQVKGDSMILDLMKLRKDVETQITYRKGLRAAAGASSSATMEEDAADSTRESSCAIA